MNIYLIKCYFLVFLGGFVNNIDLGEYYFRFLMNIDKIVFLIVKLYGRFFRVS